MGFSKLLNSLIGRTATRKRDHTTQPKYSDEKIFSAVSQHNLAKSAPFLLDDQKHVINHESLTRIKSVDATRFGNTLNLTASEDEVLDDSPSRKQHVIKKNCGNHPITTLLYNDIPTSASRNSDAPRKPGNCRSYATIGPGTPVPSRNIHPISGNKLCRRMSCPTAATRDSISATANRPWEYSSAKPSHLIRHRVMDSRRKSSPDAYDAMLAQSARRYERSLLTRSHRPNRVRFACDTVLHETFSKTEYDRHPAVILPTDTMPIIEVYRELMRFKLTEMLVHEASLGNTNQHLAHLRGASYAVMVGELQQILTESVC